VDLGRREPRRSDCNGNGQIDFCDIVMGFSGDRNGNAPDECDIAGGASPDCNTNGWPDECDVLYGWSADQNNNGTPDECEQLTGDLDCDGTVGFGDINPFVLLLTNYQAYVSTFPYCLASNGDINNDGEVNFGDINPFVELLTEP
jgi:hypothetical protein